MKILFNSDIFHCPPTGIHRYARELVKKLSQDPDITLMFISGVAQDQNRIYELLDEIFEEEIANEPVRYKLNGESTDIDPWHYTGKLYRTHRDYVRFRKTGAKLKREVYRLLAKLETKRNQGRDFRFAIEPGEGLYFSPFSHPGKQEDAIRGIPRAEVVYDMTPILHPEFLSKEHRFKEYIENYEVCDLLFSISENTKHDLLKVSDKVDPEKIRVVPLAASERFRPIDDEELMRKTKEKYKIPADARYIICVATILPHKNQNRVIEAWQKIKAKHADKNIRLVFGGGKGWDEPYMKAFNSLCDADDTVEHLGFVDDEDLPVLYAGSEFTAYPSFYEGFGLPILEAFRCGKFCITSNNSSIPEVTGDEVPLINPESVDEIAALMDRLLNEPAYLKSLEAKALERAKLFSWDRVAQDTIDGFKNLLEAKKREAG